MNEKIFRQYDIRGAAGVDFDETFAFHLGRAFSESVCEEIGNDSPTVAVGRDCRTSSPGLAKALIDGIRAGGVNVVDTGLGPTPQLYYSVFARDLDGGIQVTASHNPGQDNGFKLMVGKRTMSGDDIQVLKQKVLASLERGISDDRPGGLETFDAKSAYLEELVARAKPHVRDGHQLKVVVDAGNGMGGEIGPELLRRLGCEVVEMYTEPDGTFPNHHPDPTVLENLQEIRERVCAEGADVGIAWDGDADRIGVVDNTGDVVWGDMLLVLYGRAMASEVDKPIIIGDVKCSEVMFSTLQDAGAETVMWRTGHSLIKAKLKELNAHLAGEMSGHMFFSHRYYGYDDALHASARLIEILSNTDKTVQELLADVPKTVSTPEIRMEVPEEIKFEIPERAKAAFAEYPTNTMDGVRVTFPAGWGLVRASNTGPVLVLRFEADSEENLKTYQTLVESRIRDVITELQ